MQRGMHAVISCWLLDAIQFKKFFFHDFIFVSVVAELQLSSLSLCRFGFGRHLRDDYHNTVVGTVTCFCYYGIVYAVSNYTVLQSCHAI
jgi:hypothetical protein